jgi:aspartate/methionine/tyrosine aminotransferase
MPNRLTQAVSDRRAHGVELLDLTESNPTRAGLFYPADLLAALGDARGLMYVPRPLGVLEAREAVARDYARRGFAVDAARVVVTASTSDAYSLLFKVLADAGDEVLVPRPSYPLFDHLARLDLVVPRQYDLDYHGRWAIDFDSLGRVWTSRTRVVLLVSPNNPTGSFVSQRDLDRLAAICAEHDAAIVVDEVFADYPLDAGAAATAGRVVDRRDVLAFSLGGLSKSAGLPQVKLGWIAAGGPDALVAEALERIEFASDTYLSVATPVQLAAAQLLAQGEAIRDQIARRIRANYQRFSDEASASGVCRALPAEGGWYGVLRVPSVQSEEDLVLDLVTKDGVLVHPGYFFDFPIDSHLIVSLLTPDQTFLEGLRRILGRTGVAGA